ncbi:uncharacterized protein LOC100142016 [Tribolium castaneum]|uniref:Uncharacterized protein n=1 Tax=Tribolium castaneum TaxID=7070 RepID=D6WJY8_TRICA|nr:PREDICTED: uncharacterized protein LOC100142016 [Tribolium castaneum]EFA03641.1 hypothetical protein TcasGA2_TC013735 [Tribolium castaneum]|eukprot:XP_001814398.1 PREDICTED: uncharacterized protein LOC100142016 [Tribolium castaneum]
MALPAAIALSGLNKEYFSDGLNDVFNHGAVLLKSPSLSSIASSDDAYSQESGISSMSSETSIARNLAPYFNMLFNTSHIELKSADDPEPKAKPEVREIMYENRDILNLASNIAWKWDCKSAVLQTGPSYFFENRSQYSRVLGAHMPEHVIVTCPVEGCSYKELHYF